MTPTVYVALLTHQTGQGVPLLLSLHTTEEAATSALLAAMRKAWDASGGLSYGLGPSADWEDHDLLVEASHKGYTATVGEYPVELSG